MLAIVGLSQTNGKGFNKPKNEITHIIESYYGQWYRFSDAIVILTFNIGKDRLSLYFRSVRPHLVMHNGSVNVIQ